MSTLVEDEELQELRAMAEGSRPFEELSEWEAVAALDLTELRKRDARTRLALGLYVHAKLRSARPEEATAPG